MPLRLLFVDDDPDIRTIVELALGLDPTVQLHVAASASEALNAMAAWSPDAALLDVSMPDMDGPALLAALHDRALDLPAIFMTAHGRERDVAALHAIGARGVIVKPFDPLSLSARIRALLSD
ncbi:response regulator [Sphingomonas sp. BK580]|uniref:response regulator n=1 Tax=Sphingomonas sp. BK580 TaxID=2586972 RepID=UPI00160E1512|nr:response regulator [Sphingomonas sp. BK580]MBB3691931.1 DNA-binding response OmpR family regulator [Sphingomonas sp. BK580]